MSQLGRLTPEGIERAVASALAESNGTPWDLAPQEAAGDCVYHRDARAVIKTLRDLGILAPVGGR